ncbi:Alanyl-tRNA synthetase [Rhynchospora pubera]|uniref:Alanyl-tRNA synthetase n=1 Tax=Rhynchospora pubera TaxID=906938 RepID=A0AAV8HT85_9POAL|nr:Alanyl-tRNA synthetase [Rhynchospora pubera]
MDGTTAPVTRLLYFDDMWALQSRATVLSFQEDGTRQAVILDATIFHPQGGGQPADTGFIVSTGDEADEQVRFLVEDVRSKDGVVYHYGKFEEIQDQSKSHFREGKQVNLHVDEERRNLNSRLHSAGHLLDICIRNVSLSHLEPGKGYHFPDGPFVEYKGTITHDQLEAKRLELEKEANTLISKGAKVSACILPYEVAAEWCGGALPSYISRDSTPRILKFGEHDGCPCGGTHVSDISVIGSLKVTQIRTKKGVTKVSYSIDP